MLKQLLLSCFLCILFASSFAQQPLSVYAEVGVVPRYRDVPYAVRAGLAFGRHDFALEYGIGTKRRVGYRYGLRYRLVLPASAAGARVLPFLQGGLALSNQEFVRLGSNTINRSFNVDIATGLQVTVWKGLRLSAHAGLRYFEPLRGPDGVFPYDNGQRAFAVGGLGLAYALQGRGYQFLPHRPVPDIAKPIRPRHEVGLTLVAANVFHYFLYADMRVHYAYRVHRRWDLRGAVDLPIWPIGGGYYFPFMDFWRPGVYAGARFWAVPSARFSVFGECGLNYIRRYLPGSNQFFHRAAQLEPGVITGIRANVSPALSVELSNNLRVMPYPGTKYGIADNSVHFGLSYRFGKPHASDILEDI